MSKTHKDQRKHRHKVGGKSKGLQEHNKRKKRRKVHRPFKSDRQQKAPNIEG